MSIILTGNDAQTVPQWFRDRLRHIDPALICYWNRMREVFVIDRCTKGQDCLKSDHSFCERTNVMIFPHIGEQVLNDLQSRDAWNRFGGNDAAAFERFTKDHENRQAAHDAKVKQDITDDWKAACREDNRQLRKVFDLITRHDVARPNK